MKLPKHGRYEYVPLDARPTYEWPEGKRLAVTICNNVEVFGFLSGMGSDGASGLGPQTTRNYAWRDYGNRVGQWYMFDLFDELGVPASHNLNSLALDECPQVGERIRARGDEVIGHGRTNAERQDGLWEIDEARLIADSTNGIAGHMGAPPKGWLGPYLTQSRVTLDLLQEAGYEYVLDWPADDQPFWMKTRKGRILSVPYSVELNDSPTLVFRQQSATDFERMIVDQFDELLHQSRKRPLVCTIVVHNFIIGQPFRLRALRRALQHVLSHRGDIWLTTPGRISDYCRSLPEGVVPGSASG
ncbi:MAG: polysaccharide deacetylase [Salinarimonadaceae bacterium]|nr:MAG: polysaccharide deacetylase [Salinarimonadaceae bacterium]